MLESFNLLSAVIGGIAATAATFGGLLAFARNRRATDTEAALNAWISFVEPIKSELELVKIQLAEEILARKTERKHFEDRLAAEKKLSNGLKERIKELERRIELLTGKSPEK